MDRNKYKISKYNFETKETQYFDNIEEVAQSINSNQEPWKVQMLISYAIISKKKAFKCGWRKIIEK